MISFFPFFPFFFRLCVKTHCITRKPWWRLWTTSPCPLCNPISSVPSPRGLPFPWRLAMRQALQDWWRAWRCCFWVMLFVVFTTNEPRRMRESGWNSWRLKQQRRRRSNHFHPSPRWCLQVSHNEYLSARVMLSVLSVTHASIRGGRPFIDNLVLDAICTIPVSMTFYGLLF